MEVNFLSLLPRKSLFELVLISGEEYMMVFKEESVNCILYYIAVNILLYEDFYMKSLSLLYRIIQGCYVALFTYSNNRPKYPLKF